MGNRSKAQSTLMDPEEIAENPVEIEAAAYHEAGHTVAAHHLGLRYRSVFVMSNGEGKFEHEYLYEDRATGQWFRAPDPTPEQSLVLSFAGPVAQRRFKGRVGSRWNNGDINQMDEIALSAWGDSLLALLKIRESKGRAYRLIKKPENWTAVEAIARALIDRHCLRYEEAEAIIEAAIESHRKVGNGRR